MDIKDVIADLKGVSGQTKRVHPRTKARGALAERIHRYGIKTLCMLCGFEGRHRPGEARLRERPCGSCGYKFLRALWWVKKYPTKAEVEWKRNNNLRFML